MSHAIRVKRDRASLGKPIVPIVMERNALKRNAFFIELARKALN